jgi:hypothetical protein
MARPTTLRGSKLLILLGDGATPTEAFVAPCALATKGINFSSESNDFNVPDCSDPDAPTFVERVVSALSAGVDGSGTLAMESLSTWWDWWVSGEPKNIRVKVDALLAEGGGHWAMSAVLTSFNVGGNNGELATVEVGIASNGEITWVDAAA